MNILIVDDNLDKIRCILGVLNEASTGEVFVGVAHTSHEAREKLLHTSWDVLVLDICLPRHYDTEPEQTEGITLLRELYARDKYKMPRHIVGLTAYQELFLQAAPHFEKRLLTVMEYSDHNDGWRSRLAQVITQTARSTASDLASCPAFKFDVGVVCALRTPELAALSRQPFSWEDKHAAGDDTRYWAGKMPLTEDRTLDIVSCYCDGMGMPAACATTAGLIHAFRPRMILMLGIAAGFATRAEYGDVLVADPSWDYGAGKWSESDGRLVLSIQPHQLDIEARVRRVFEAVSEDHNFLSRVKHDWPAAKPSAELKVRVGPVASGAAVIASKAYLTDLVGQHRKLLGIDMETYGVYVACRHASAPRPIFASVKSVVDFADEKKDDRFQEYGCHTSVAVGLEFLRRFFSEAEVLQMAASEEIKAR